MGRAQPVTVLLVEDNRAEAELVLDELAFARRPGFIVHHVTTMAAATDALSKAAHDVVVLDLGLPDSTGLAGVHAIRAAAAGAAIVVRSGLADKRVAIAALEAGVHDYLLKGVRQSQDALERSILFALARRQADESSQRLARAERLFEAAFAHAPIGVAIGGLSSADRGRLLHVNAALGRMLGRSREELEGALIGGLSHPDDVGAWEDEAMAKLDRNESVEFETRYVHKDGHAIWVLVSATPLPDARGRPELAVAQLIDISERKRFEDQLRYLADHDPLTGLLNRQRFDAELERVIAESRRYQRPGALLMLDLDGFKTVNDRFGHPAGDELVRRIAWTLRRAVRDVDIVARVGGDEFALILLEAGEREAATVAGKIIELLREQAAVVVGAERVQVTASLGIATFDSEPELAVAELFSAADTAMYDAKAAGRDQFRIFDRAADRPRAIHMRRSWQERLRGAVDRDQFELHAQPIVDICGNGVPRFEVLLRMRDGGGNLVPPGAFLFNAERFGLIGEIDRWVLRRTIRLLHDQQRQGHDLSLAVNLSGKTMNDLRLADDLAAILERYPITPGRLVVEVTETAAIVNIERARNLARDLRTLGCEFALDDFGAGFASFYFLKHLDFDYLKIDGEFITNLVTDSTDRLVVQAVVDIARGLGTRTIAEFVGDEATTELLHVFGIDYAQGYHLGRPGPIAETLARRYESVERRA
jgi:diguanylate cyclase (GGDEF)-like protein/PAS domain S-box-containing protein